jgi:hypothetical protein
MNMTRLMVVAAVGLLSSAWARADPAVPGHYTIDLGNWDPDQEFDFIPNVTIPGDLTNNPCYPVGDICGDPSVRLEPGGKSQSEDGSFTFDSGPTGTIVLDYQNTGSPITTAEIMTTLTSDESGPNVLFSCSSGIFQDCAFVVTDPLAGDIIDTYFWDPYVAGGIATAVPEPSLGIVLLLAFAGVIVGRARKGSASSSFAQTQR